jgi:hypothetical protein
MLTSMNAALRLLRERLGLELPSLAGKAGVGDRLLYLVKNSVHPAPYFAFCAPVDYSRCRPERGLLGYPAFLRDRWGLERTTQIPAYAWARVRAFQNRSSSWPPSVAPAENRIDPKALLLEAAWGPPRRAERAWREWSDDQSIDSLGAEHHSLLSRIYRNLQAAAPAQEMARLKSVWRYHWCRRIFLFGHLAPLIAQWNSLGTDVMALGPLAMEVDCPRARPLDRFDLLVLPQPWERLLLWLKANGWTKHELAPDTWMNRHNLQITFHQQPSSLWLRARQGCLGSSRLLLPCPTDLLLHTCVKRLTPDWAVDALEIVRSEKLDWAWLVQQAERWECLPESLAGLRELETTGYFRAPRRVVLELRLRQLMQLLRRLRL